jgi:hypothetical protein
MKVSNINTNIERLNQLSDSSINSPTLIINITDMDN